MSRKRAALTVIFAAMLFCTISASAFGDVRVTKGVTPIPSGDAVGKNDITLQNSRLAVSFAAETPAPWGVARGGIIDAAVVRDGRIEMDRVTLVDFIPNNWSSWPTTYQTVEILKNTPEEGVVRTTRDWEKVDLETVFTLKKGSDRIHMTTTATNKGKEPYTDILSGYVLWTDGGHLFTTPGMAEIKKGTAEAALADWVVNYDETWSVGLHAPYFDFINYYARDMYLKHTLKPGETRVFEGWLQIDGHGDISSMLAFEIERKALSSGKVQGLVSIDGKPVENAVVVAEKNGKPYAWTLAPKGRYDFTLPQGEYALYSAGKSYASSSPQTITVRPESTVEKNFTDMKYPGTVVFNVGDSRTGKPLDARITIEKGETPLVGFLGKKTFFTQLLAVGQLEVPIAPGNYLFKVAHGESFVSKASTVEAHVLSGEKEQLKISVETVDRPSQTGWYSCDMHHHSNLLDGVTPPEYVVRSQLAGGLDFTLLSDHDLVKNNPEMKELSDKRGIRFIPSIEISPSWSHFNAFPVVLGRKLGIDPGTASVDEIFQAARSMGAIAISANHPYIPYGYFHSLDNNLVPGGFNPQFDLVELNSACKYKKTIQRLWQLWNQGTRYYLSAGTDTHDVWKDVSGGIRMVAKIDGQDVTPETFVTALLDGHAYATFGPMVEPEVMFGREIKVESGDPLELKFTVKAAEGLKEVQLVSNSKVVETISLADQNVTEKEIAFKVTPTADTWYALVISDVTDKLAWTNPIWVDVLAYTPTPKDM